MTGLVVTEGVGSGLDATGRMAVVGTAVFAVLQVAADVHPSGAVLAIAVTWSLAGFVLGSVLFLMGFLVAAGRSRDEQVTLAGLVWLTNAAPARVAFVLRWCLITQVLVAIATAAVRPFSPLAFGILAPMFGLGCLAWWAARHGTFVPVDAAVVTGGAGDVPRSPSSPSDVGTPSAERDESPPSPVGNPHRASASEDPDDFDQLFRRRRRKR